MRMFKLKKARSNEEQTYVRVPDACLGLLEWLAARGNQASLAVVPPDRRSPDILAVCEEAGLVEYSDFIIEDPLDAQCIARWFWCSRQPAEYNLNDLPPHIDENPPGDVNGHPYIRLTNRACVVLSECRLRAEQTTPVPEEIVSRHHRVWRRICSTAAAVYRITVEAWWSALLEKLSGR